MRAHFINEFQPLNDSAQFLLNMLAKLAPQPLHPRCLALTLMLGTLFDSRGAVMGIPLVIILGFTLFPMFFPPSFVLLPYALTMSGGGMPSVALALAMGQPIPSLLPIMANAAWVVLFTCVSVWRFQHEEF